MKNKLNNKGFTLAELIIAIAILAIVISPLLANFIESGKMNKKSRTSMDATTMAQDFMEGASAYTASDFIALFESEESLSNKILPNSLAYDSHGDYTKDGSGNVENCYEVDVNNLKVDNNIGDRNYSTNVVNGIVSSKDIKKCDDYYFFLRNVQKGDKTYNYDLRLTTTLNNYNDFVKVANVSNIDKAFDVTYSITDDEYNQALVMLKNNSTKNALLNDNSKFNNNVERNVTVNIKNRGTEAAPDYLVEVLSDYTVKDSAASTLGLVDVNKRTVRPRTGTNVSNLKSNQMPRCLYLYYEGMQGSTMSTRNDHFVINNTTGKPLTVFLIRNRVSGTSGDSTYNLNYGTEVSINSEDKAGNDNTLTEIVSNQRFNLNYKLDDNKRVYKEGTATKLPDITDAMVGNTKYKAERCNYLYNGSVVNETLYESNFSDGYQKDVKDFVYQLRVSIFEINGSDSRLVSEFSGSLSD